jgi:hypothetical protein
MLNKKQTDLLIYKIIAFFLYVIERFFFNYLLLTVFITITNHLFFSPYVLHFPSSIFELVSRIYIINKFSSSSFT